MRAAFSDKINDFGEGKYILNWTYFVWFFFAATIASITMLATQVEQGILYNAAVMQLLTGVVGLLAGMSFVLMGTYKIRKDLKQDIENYGLWSVIGFAGARIAGALVGAIESMNSIFITNLTIVLTAAIMEEALFSLCLCTLLYIALKPTLERMFGEDIGNILTVLLTAGIVSYAFAMFHLGVYGTELSIILYLSATRFVYSIVYLASRNILAPTYAHLLHNALLLFMGG